jgi:hypothetical protein
MSNINKKKNSINLVALIGAAFLVFIYLIGVTYAWFTDEGIFETTDNVANIEMQLLDDTSTLITQPPQFTYTGAQTHNYEVNVASTQTSFDAVVRVMIMGTWTNGLPPYIGEYGSTVNYNINTTNFSESTAGVGFDYVYYNTVLLPGQTVTFLNSISIPSLPSEYLNQTLTLTVSAEGLQASNSAVQLWQNQTTTPTGWAPLS